MIVKTSYADIPADGAPMRVLVAEPAATGGRYAALLVYADIFGLTDPTIRAAVRLAGYGFVVAAPEFYRAEEYHQRYLEKRGQRHCAI